MILCWRFRTLSRSLAYIVCVNPPRHHDVWQPASPLGKRLTAESFEKYRRQGGLVATFTNTEEMVERNMAHPLVMVASDGILETGLGHPHVARTNARVLGRYVRERKALSFAGRDPQDVTVACPASGVHGAGADIVIFNPDTVTDRATFEKPNLPSEGIPHVLVRGTFGWSEVQSSRESTQAMAFVPKSWWR